MQGNDRSEVARRSSRVPIAVPLLVTSMDPGNDFSEVCETVVVSAHGCALRSPMKVKAGVPVHLHTREGREMMARIVDCQPISSTPQAWKLGAQLDEPANFWGLNPCPEDWNGRRHAAKANPEASAEPTLTADRLRHLVAPLLQPLQAEVAGLSEKLAQRQANPSRFEVSLSQIPPQLEQELWARLRQDLGQRSLELTRGEAQRILDSAQAAIEARISQSQEELRQHACGQLEDVAQRARALADESADAVQQHFHAALERFQQGAADAEARLAQQGEALGQALRQQAEEEHQAQRRELGRLRDKLAAEWSHIEAQLAEVDSRLGRLDDSARHLESEFDTHISGMASDLVSRTKLELENAVEAVFRQLKTRNARELGTQLDDACGRLKAVRSEVEAASAEALQELVSQTTRSFEQSLHELAQRCVEGWRRALASQLNSFAGLLGEDLRVDPSRRAGD